MQSSNKLVKIIIALFLALIVGRFIIVGLPKILFNHQSSDGDESAYLSLGLDLLEEGVLSDGTRPPLYSLLLTPFAERSWSYFTSAKLLTLGLGAATILATFWVGVRLFGWQTALLAVFLLGANKEFHIRSATVYADVLLALVMIGGWYFLIKSIAGWRQSLLAGVFVGLAFLTKGSAPVMLAAWGGMALFHYRLAIFRQFHLLLVPLFFIIVSSPLLLYNARTFGSPTYNFATQHIMWMDRLAQIDTADPDDLPTAADYFATHTPADMVERVEEGLERLNPVISRSLNPNRTFEPAWLGPALGLLAVGILLYLLLFQRPATLAYLKQHKNAYLFTLFLYGLFYPFFTWYVAGSSAETRFVVPLLAPLYLLLADVAITLGRALNQRLSRNRSTEAQQSAANSGQRSAVGGRHSPITNYQLLITNHQLPKIASRLALALILGWSVWWLISTAWVERWALSINPYQSDRAANQEEEALLQWLIRDTEGDAFVSFGPSKSLPLWKFPRRFTIERLPVGVDEWPAMEAYVAEQRPDYIILDEDTVRRRRQALGDYFSYNEEAALIDFERHPDGWALALIDPELPCRWCIFSPVDPEDAQPLATFANGLELVDIRLANERTGELANDSSTDLNDSSIFIHHLPSSVHNSQFTIHNSQLRAILTWRTPTPLPANYTFFVHLTAPDGFVKAQQDRPPFDGLLPTTEWQPGSLYADRYDIPLDENMPPGDYLLLAGMYDSVTGERVPLTTGERGPAPETILVGGVRVE